MLQAIAVSAATVGVHTQPQAGQLDGWMLAGFLSCVVYGASRTLPPLKLCLFCRAACVGVACILAFRLGAWPAGLLLAGLAIEQAFNACNAGQAVDEQEAISKRTTPARHRISQYEEDEALHFKRRHHDGLN